MPNHFHGLLYIPEDCPKNLNQIISNAKRFLAYEIISRLKEQGKENILNELEDGVQANEQLKGKRHQVFKLSFDAKECISEKEIEIKLAYIHHNPVTGKWRLADDFAVYPYSSAAFYETDQKNEYLTHYKELV